MSFTLSFVLLLSLVSCVKPTPISVQNSAPRFLAKLRGDHNVQGQFTLHKWLINKAKPTYLHHDHHAHVPYPPNHHGSAPGSYPPPIGHSHQPYDHHHECDGYTCKTGNGYNHYHGEYDPYYHHQHGFNQGFDHHVCDHPGHNHMKPHYHPDNDLEKEPVTDLPSVNTDKTKPATESKNGITTSKTATTTTTTASPTYDIDIRSGSR